MLTDEEMERQADESAQAVAELELALLGMAASSMLALRSRKEVAKSASELQRRATKAAADALPAIERAVQADCEAAMGASVAREASGESAKVADKARRDALKAAKAATKEGKAQAKRIARNMARSCRQEYVQAAYMAMLKAGSAPGGDDFQKAVGDGVARMARKGLAATTYTRQDGTVVHVPCDVGIRRAVEAAGKERQRDQSIAVAKATTGLVYVNTTSGARESHRRWQGAVYRVVDLEPGDPNYAAVMKYPSFDAVVGDQMHDYNCRHRLRKWRDGRALPKDELEGTGYTQEQAYAARSRQRAMQNDIRHLKREREVLDKAGLDTSDVTRRIRLKEQRLAAHVKKHGKVLKREKWWEDIYGTERRRDNTYGRVWLSASDKADAARSARLAAADTKLRKAEREKLIEKCSSSKTPVFMDRKTKNDRDYIANFPKVKRLDGFYDVGLHGSATRVQAFGEWMDYKSLWRAIESRGDYDGGGIRLLSCSAGAVDEKGFCFAQALADYSGKVVVAPTARLWIAPDGRVIIGEDWIEPEGEMATFYPKGGEGA